MSSETPSQGYTDETVQAARSNLHHRVQQAIDQSKAKAETVHRSTEAEVDRMREEAKSANQAKMQETAMTNARMAEKVATLGIALHTRLEARRAATMERTRQMEEEALKEQRRVKNALRGSVVFQDVAEAKRDMQSRIEQLKQVVSKGNADVKGAAQRVVMEARTARQVASEAAEMQRKEARRLRTEFDTLHSTR
ncbi:hypothetical protein BC830DRAFT_1167231 [Chytriomyces sp. MP71]|nr:hypothetical protein BC830DRAFT_1167231 [Chytriomyces sp. MP71]